MQRYKVIQDAAHSSDYYYGGEDTAHLTANSVGAKRYLNRARAAKRIDPNGTYAGFDLSSNRAGKGLSHNRGEILFG